MPSHFRALLGTNDLRGAGTLIERSARIDGPGIGANRFEEAEVGGSGEKCERPATGRRLQCGDTRVGLADRGQPLATWRTPELIVGAPRWPLTRRDPLLARRFIICFSSPGDSLSLSRPVPPLVARLSPGTEASGGRSPGGRRIARGPAPKIRSLTERPVSRVPCVCGGRPSVRRALAHYLTAALRGTDIYSLAGSGRRVHTVPSVRASRHSARRLDCLRAARWPPSARLSSTTTTGDRRRRRAPRRRRILRRIRAGPCVASLFLEGLESTGLVRFFFSRFETVAQQSDGASTKTRSAA